VLIGGRLVRAMTMRFPEQSSLEIRFASPTGVPPSQADGLARALLLRHMKFSQIGSVHAKISKENRR
jgi:hypothetical protein